jgi:DNA-binding transcriptional ArsR family regulator
MKHTVIALVGDNMEALFMGIREFPTERIVLITPEKQLDKAQKVMEDLKKFGIPVKITEIKGNIWMESFKVVAETKKFAPENSLLINVGTSDCTLGCALTSAAFVNGIKAFTVSEGEIVFLPVLKFSYYKMLTQKKLDILKTLYREKQCCASLESLSRKLGMSLPLVSYHINGTLKSEGLKQLGLVDTAEKKGRVEVHLSTLGKLLVRGYID